MHLINTGDVGRKPAMNAEHGAVNNCSNRQKIKDSGAIAPGICISVLILALI